MVYETNAPNLVASGLGVMVLAALLHAAALATAAAGLPLWVFTSTTALLGLRVDRWRPSTVVLAGLAYAGLDVWLDDVACQVAQAVSTCSGQMALWQPLTHVLVGARLLCWPLHYVLTAVSRDETEWLLLQGAEDGSRPPIAIQRSLPGHRQVYVTKQLHVVLHGEASFARLPSGTVKVYATTARRVLEYGAFRLVVQNRGFTGEQLAQLDALHMNALRQQLLDAHADATPNMKARMASRGPIQESVGFSTFSGPFRITSTMMWGPLRGQAAAALVSLSGLATSLAPSIGMFPNGLRRHLFAEKLASQADLGGESVDAMANVFEHITGFTRELLHPCAVVWTSCHSTSPTRGVCRISRIAASFRRLQRPGQRV